jgi:hypothetical protein
MHTLGASSSAVPVFCRSGACSTIARRSAFLDCQPRLVLSGLRPFPKAIPCPRQSNSFPPRLPLLLLENSRKTLSLPRASSSPTPPAAFLSTRHTRSGTLPHTARADCRPAPGLWLERTSRPQPPPPQPVSSPRPQTYCLRPRPLRLRHTTSRSRWALPPTSKSLRATLDTISEASPNA